jgi:hypothetical protein
VGGFRSIHLFRPLERGRGYPRIFDLSPSILLNEITLIALNSFRPWLAAASMIKNDFDKTNKNIILDFLLLFLDGEPIKLPENLESLPRADHFPNIRHRWNTNEVSDTETKFCSCPLKGDVKEDKFT